MLKDIYFKRNSYKKIHFIWSVLIFVEVFLFIIIQNKLIFTFHNDVPHSYKKKTFWVYKVIMKLASTIVFVSNYTMKKFIKNYGTHLNTHLIQHGIMPIETLSPSLIRSSVEVDKSILFWGRVEEYKGVDVFCDFTTDYPVEIYGKWSSQLTTLKKKLSLMKNVLINDSYLPFDELSTMLSRNVVFILPYKDATQSGVLYSYLAYGNVFISSNVGENNNFLIKHGLERLIFDREDQDSIISAIDYAFNRHNEIKIKLLQIREKFEWEVVMSNKIIGEVYGF